MSKHNKWSQIKRKKAVTDLKRAQAFTKLSKLITIAAKQGGGSSDTNPALILLLQKAKAANMTKELIERAIKKGTGEGASALDIQEVLYEGYSPHGVAMIVRTLTDNRTRTIGNIRHIFSKYGGQLGEAGAVSFLFQKRGIVEISYLSRNRDEVELTAIDAGALDFEEIDDTQMQIVMEVSDMHKVKQAVENIEGVRVEDMKISYIPTMDCKIPTGESLDEVINFIDLLEENEDVDEVFTNLVVE